MMQQFDLVSFDLIWSVLQPLVWLESNRIESNRIALHCIALHRFGLDWIGLDWIGSDHIQAVRPFQSYLHIFSSTRRLGIQPQTDSRSTGWRMCFTRLALNHLDGLNVNPLACLFSHHPSVCLWNCVEPNQIDGDQTNPKLTSRMQHLAGSNRRHEFDLEPAAKTSRESRAAHIGFRFGFSALGWYDNLILFRFH